MEATTPTSAGVGNEGSDVASVNPVQPNASTEELVQSSLANQQPRVLNDSSRAVNYRDELLGDDIEHIGIVDEKGTHCAFFAVGVTEVEKEALGEWAKKDGAVEQVSDQNDVIWFEFMVLQEPTDWEDGNSKQGLILQPPKPDNIIQGARIRLQTVETAHTKWGLLEIPEGDPAIRQQSNLRTERSAADTQAGGRSISAWFNNSRAAASKHDPGHLGQKCISMVRGALSIPARFYEEAKTKFLNDSATGLTIPKYIAQQLFYLPPTLILKDEPTPQPNLQTRSSRRRSGQSVSGTQDASLLADETSLPAGASAAASEAASAAASAAASDTSGTSRVDEAPGQSQPAQYRPAKLYNRWCIREKDKDTANTVPANSRATKIRDIYTLWGPYGSEQTYADYVDDKDMSKWTPDRNHHDTYTISNGSYDHKNAKRKFGKSIMIFNEDNKDPADYKFSVEQEGVERHSFGIQSTGRGEVAARMFRSVPQDLNDRLPRHDSESTEAHNRKRRQVSTLPVPERVPSGYTPPPDANQDATRGVPPDATQQNP